MKSSIYKQFFGILAFSMILTLGAGISVSGQKGHGKGKEKGEHKEKGERHGGGEEKGRGDDEGRGGWKRREMGGWQVQQQQPQQQPAQVWQQAERRHRDNDGGGRGKGNGKWKRDRGGEQRVFDLPQQPSWGGWVPPGQIRRQEVHARNDARKALKNEMKAIRKERRDDYNDDRRDYRRERRSFDPAANSGLSRWIDRGSRLIPGFNESRPVYENRQVYRDGRRDRQPYAYSQPAGTQYNNYDPNYYQGPVSTRYYSDAPGLYAYDNDNNYYGDASGSSSGWKQQILRTLISSVLGGVLGGNSGGFDQQYDPYSSGMGGYGYQQPYAYQQTGYAEPNSYYGGFSPQYAGFNQSYTPYSSYGRQLGGFDPSMGGGLLNSIPIAGILGHGGSGSSFITQMLTQILAQGYVQGLLAGENAREQGYGEDAYYDPYVSQEGIYDPYSTTIGENRRLMSEGYDLGFQDALDGETQFDPGSVGSVDLVSLLLGNVLSLN